MNDGPLPGDAGSLHSGTYLDLDNTGENELWDYSTVGSGAISDYTFEDIDGDPNENDFPEADVVMVSGVSRGYIKVDAQGFHQVGQKYFSTLTFLTDPITSIKYPNTYGTQWVDPWNGYTTNGYMLSGELHGTTNGHGTLRLPWGDVENVLRIELIDTTAQLGTAPSDQYFVIDTTVLYYKNGYPNYLLRTLKRLVMNMGSGTSQSYLHYATQESIVGMGEQWLTGIGVDVFPNPANDQVIITATMMAAGTLEAYDPIGRTMAALDLNNAPGIITQPIDVSTWPPGVYTLKIIDNLGNEGVKRLVVQ